MFWKKPIVDVSRKLRHYFGRRSNGEGRNENWVSKSWFFDETGNKNGRTNHFRARGEGRQTSNKLWSHTKIQVDSSLTDFFINHVRAKVKNLFAPNLVTHVSELLQSGLFNLCFEWKYLRQSRRSVGIWFKGIPMTFSCFDGRRGHSARQMVFCEHSTKRKFWQKINFHSVERQQIKIHRQVFKSNFISSSWWRTVTVAFVQQRTHVRWLHALGNKISPLAFQWHQHRRGR